MHLVTKKRMQRMIGSFGRIKRRLNIRIKRIEVKKQYFFLMLATTYKNDTRPIPPMKNEKTIFKV